MAGEGGTIGDHLDWLRWRNLRPSSIRQRAYTLRRFTRHTGVHPLDATPADISIFRDRLTRAGQQLSAESQASELAHLAGFYRWAVLEDRRQDDPMLRVPRPRLPRGLPRPIPELELQLALAEASDRVRPWMMLAAYAGLRAFEVAALRGEDLWWHTDPPVIVVTEGKGGDAGVVPMAPVLARELAGRPKRGYLFARLDGAPGPLQGHNVSHLVNGHLHRIGLSYTMHTLRHRFGTQVHRTSGDLRQTQELMRHRSPVSTAIYTMVDQDVAAGIVAALPVA